MIPASSDWLAATAAFGRSRGPELIALDGAILAFGSARNAKARDDVGTAWAAWKAKHSSIEKPFFDNKRNKSGMLEILEAEFNPDGLNSPKSGAMCRIKLQFPDVKPPGFANVDDALMLDRIDKAFIEAQAVLRVTVGRLRRADAPTKELAKTWFGTTTSLSTVLAQYEKVQQYVDTTLKHGAVPLEIRWSTEAKDIASTTYHAKFMSFGAMFFDDVKAVPSTQLGAAPGVPKNYVESMRGMIAEFDKLKADQNILMDIESYCTKPGATVGEAMAAWLKMNSSSGTNLKVMTAALAPFDIDADDPRDVARAKAQAAAAASARREAEMLADSDSRRPPVSTSGVVIHELTHLVLQTDDVSSPLFKTKTPSYGPGTCLHLASVSPIDAFRNADNYRLFAESCGF